LTIRVPIPLNFRPGVNECGGVFGSGSIGPFIFSFEDAAQNSGASGTPQWVNQVFSVLGGAAFYLGQNGKAVFSKYATRGAPGVTPPPTLRPVTMEPPTTADARCSEGHD
jgi:hypothetical protein